MKKQTIFFVSISILSFPVLAQVKIRKDVSTQPQVAEAVVNTSPTLKKSYPGTTFKQVYDFSNVKICVDKPSNYDPGPRQIKTYPDIPRIDANGQLEPGVARQKLSVETKKMWRSEDAISVAFAPNEASDFVTNKVKQYAQVWESVANIKFNFTNDWRNALIKIGFKKGDSWSWIGRDVFNNPFGHRTMNFGWFDNNTPEDEFSRVVIHEFGHALGFIHEHQAANANIKWDVEKVYAFFEQNDGWSRADVDHNIFNKYSQTSTNGTVYDKTSIMHYFFPQGLTTDNTSFSFNTALSPLDKQFAREIYPFPPTPSNATGVLRTGDDCDAIQFTVEYNAVASNMIEFNLRPGIDNAGKPVTWWKQIGIPLKNGGENRTLQLLQDGLMTTTSVLVSDIDDTRGMSFAKAKFLGVHTGLGYTWKVWSALPGGCRVSFVWQNDHCY
jgi:serralysin